MIVYTRTYIQNQCSCEICPMAKSSIFIYCSFLHLLYIYKYILVYIYVQVCVCLYIHSLNDLHTQKLSYV